MSYMIIYTLIVVASAAQQKKMYCIVELNFINFFLI